MPYGAFWPYPETYGGGTPRVQHIYEALNAGRGQLYDTSDWTASVPTENRAFARAIDDTWNNNDRATNQFFPLTTTDMLPRWERIFGIPAVYGTSDDDRRLTFEFKWQALGKDPTYQQIVDDLNERAAGVFVELTHTSSTTGPAYYPGSPFANPYTEDGSTVAGVSIVDWWSNVAHVAVKVTQPTGMPSWLYQERISEILTYLDGAFPAWCTFSTYSLDVHGSLGFFLDEVNLGEEAFRI